MVWQGDYSFIKYSAYFKALYLSTFIILAFKNNQLKTLFYGLPLVWLGYGLNMLAVTANGGKMPVFVSNSWWTGYVKSDMFIDSGRFGDFHVLGDAYTKLIPLCDTWDFGYMCISIGDIAIRAFAFMIIYNSIKYTNKYKINVDKI